MGGLSEFVFILGLVAAEIFTRRLFVADMISHLYMIPKNAPPLPEKKQENAVPRKKKNKVSISSDVPSTTEAVKSAEVKSQSSKKDTPLHAPE